MFYRTGIFSSFGQQIYDPSQSINDQANDLISKSLSDSNSSSFEISSNWKTGYCTDRAVLIYTPDKSNVNHIKEIFSRLFIYPPTLHILKKIIENCVEDEAQRKCIRTAESNGIIAKPSFLEQQSLNLLNMLKKKGFEIPIFFQIWEKIIFQKDVTEADIEEIQNLPLNDQEIIYSLLFKYDRYKHIHQPPKVPVDDTDYCLNFLWIEANPRPVGQKYLGSNSNLNKKKQKKQFEDRIISVVKAWSKGNNCNISIWYHKDLTDSNVILLSERALKESIPEKSHLFKFRDISVIDLNVIGVNPEIFKTNKIYKYFKIDLSKALITDYTLRVNKEIKYTVYADLDPSAALPKDQLFDGQTISKLNQFGFIMSLPGLGGPTDGYENGFMIFDRDNTEILTDHITLLEETTLGRLQQLNSYLIQGKNPDEATKNAIIQSIYKMYTQLANPHIQKFLEEKRNSKSTPESPEAWRAICSRLFLEATIPPAKPISLPATNYKWD